MSKKVDHRDRILIPLEWFQETVAYGQQILGLLDWDITVEARPKYKAGSAFCEGEAKIHDGHLTATLIFRQDVLKGEARMNVFHELGHIMFRAWCLADLEVIEDLVPKALSKRADEALSKGEEDAVEKFAHTIVRLLPPDRKEPSGTPG